MLFKADIRNDGLDAGRDLFVEAPDVAAASKWFQEWVDKHEPGQEITHVTRYYARALPVVVVTP